MSSSSNAKEQLDNLMQFLISEVERDERINLMVAHFGLAKKDEDRNYRKKRGYTDFTKNTHSLYFNDIFQTGSKETLYVL